MENFGFPKEGTWVFEYYYGLTLLATWEVDFSRKEIKNAHIFTTTKWFRPFATESHPTWEEFCKLMNRRVYSASYEGLDDVYDKLKCSPRTRFQLLLQLHGKVAGDDFSIEGRAL